MKIINLINSLTGIVLFPLVLSGCSADDDSPGGFVKENERPNIELTDAETSLATSLHNSQIDMFAGVFEASGAAKTNDNFSFSPLSAESALLMTANATDLANSSKIVYIMGGENLDELNSYSKKIFGYLPYKGINAELIIANGLWYDKNETIAPAFESALQNFFGAEPQKLDFANAEFMIVNSWARQNTHGLIDNIVENPADLLKSKLLLANVLYYKGVWNTPFDARNTTKKPFYGTLAKNSVSMMYLYTHLKYTKLNKTEIVELPFSGDHISMYVVLPEEGKDITEFAKGFNSALYKALVDDMTNFTVTLNLPKFKSENQLYLDKYLLTKNIDVDDLPLTGAGIDTKVPFEIMQQNIIEIDENGATMASGSTGKNPTLVYPPVTVNVNRPFMYIVQENNSGTVLMMGIVKNL